MPQQTLAPPRPIIRMRRQRDVHRGLQTLPEIVLNWGARAALVALICIAPWHYGGVEPDIQVWLNWGLLFALACWSVSFVVSILANNGRRIRLPILMIPLLGALLLGASQLSTFKVFGHRDLATVETPNPSDIHSLIPHEHRAYSLYPSGTRLEIARLGMAIIACYLGIVLFSDSNSQIWLWGGFAGNGAALAFFGIVQQLSWNGKLFWTVPLQFGGQPFASFVNRNNAAGYFNLCLAAAWGLTIWSLTMTSRQSSGNRSEESAGSAQKSSLRLQTKASSKSILNGLSLTCMILAATIAAGIVCSVSRGGVLAMLVAGSVVSLLNLRSHNGRSAATLLGGIVVLGMGLVYWTGMEDRFFGRWGQTAGDSMTSGAQTRLANWNDALHALRDYPVVGTGFGTYCFAYLPYQSKYSPVRFYNADNQFVECLVEGGWIGLILMLLALGLSIASAFALIQGLPRDPVGLVGLFAVISQMASALFDFGPTLYANMIGFAVLIGAMSGRIDRLDFDSHRSAWARWLLLPELRPAATGVLISLSLLGYGLLGIADLSSAAAARVARRAVPRRLEIADALTLTEVDAAIRQLHRAVEKRHDDAETHATLANLWIYRYRNQAFGELLELNRRGGPVAKWTQTDPIVLFDQFNQWKRNDEENLVDEVRSLAVVRDNLVPAYRHLNAAQQACPLMPGLDIPIATLAPVISDEKSRVETSLRRAIALSPCDVDLLSRCSAMAQSAGLTDLMLGSQERLAILKSRLAR